MSVGPELAVSIVELLDAAGLDASVLQLTPLAGGGNNRLYRVATNDGAVLAKQYFRHEGDQRDRLAAEYAFLGHAHTVAPEACPQPLAKDDATGIALFEFIAGSPLRSGETGAVEVSAAIEFLRAINRNRRQAPPLEDAAEACFSIDAHLECVGARADAVLIALSADTIPGAASMAARLNDAWHRCHDAVREFAMRLGMDPAATLGTGQRILSPSDFGFHNALRRDNGQLCFIDFEYAGWDDPAKTVGDFFQQQAVPAPVEQYERYAAAVAAETDAASATLERIRLLRPVYAAKWCCIVLNVFLPVHIARRRFADPGLDEAALKRGQLDKAARPLAALESLIANKEAAWLT